MPYQDFEALTKDARELATQAFLLGGPDMAMQALLSAYATIAESHPAFTEIGAVMAKAVGGTLMDMHKARQHPQH